MLLNRFAPSCLFGQALLALQSLLSSNASSLNKIGEIVKIKLYSASMSADLSKLDYIAEPRYRQLQAEFNDSYVTY